MPKETTIPIDRGPGSITPDFTAPSVGVATPGLNLQPQRTSAEEFRDQIIGFGRGLAEAASAKAQIESRVKTLKENAAAKVESDLDRANRNFQVKRLDAATRQRQQILVEAEQKGMEWAEREFRSRMLNAPSAEESKLWEAAWSGASSQTSRENDEASRQAFNHAKLSMTEVASSLAIQLQEDPNTQSALIADGTGIGARVQNWMLREIRKSVNLDSMTKEDADLLIHQAIVQSANISDHLRERHVKLTQQANLETGTRQMIGDILSTATGEQEVSHLRQQIEVTLRDQMAHLTPDQQASYVREQLVETLSKVANGSLGISAATAIENTSQLLNMEVHGSKVFTKAERIALASQMQAAGEQTITRAATTAVVSLREQTRTPVHTDQGTVFRPNPAAEAALFIKDENGRDAFDREADRLLAKQGLLGLDDPTPEQSLMIGRVRAVMDQQRSGVSSDLRRSASDEANWVSVMTGNTGDGNKAYQRNPFTRVHMTGAELATNRQQDLASSDLSFVKTALSGVALTEAEQAAVNQWDGGPVAYAEENRTLNRLIAVAEARQWQEGEIQSVTGLPPKLVDAKLSLLKSGDPLKVEAFVTWASMMDVGAGGGWSNFLNAVDPNEAAAANWLRLYGRFGQPAATSSVAADPLNLMDQAQTILNAPSVGDWMGSASGQEDAPSFHTNTRTMAEVMTAIIAGENPDVNFDESGNLLAQLNNMIVSGRNSTASFVKELWFAGRTVNPTLSDEAVGMMIYQWIRKDGFRFRSLNDSTILVQDPVGYSGESGGDVTEHVTAQMTRPFSVSYRNFLQQALGVKPVDTPFTLQDMLMKQNTLLATVNQPFEPGGVIPQFSLRDQSSARMLQSRADYGGLVVDGAFHSGGGLVTLPPVVSKHDATLTWPDGSSVFVPKGTVLNVINPDLYATRSIRRDHGRPSNTGISIGGTVPGQGVTINQPFE